MTSKELFKCKVCLRTLGPTYKYNFALHMGFAHDNWSYLDAWYKSKGVPKVLWIHGRVPVKELLRKTEELKNEYGLRMQPEKHTLFERKWKCAICHAPLIYNQTLHTLSCACKIIRDYDPPETDLWAFKRVFTDIYATKYIK